MFTKSATTKVVAFSEAKPVLDALSGWHGEEWEHPSIVRVLYVGRRQPNRPGIPEVPLDADLLAERCPTANAHREVGHLC